MRHRFGVAMVSALGIGLGLVPVLAQPAVAVSEPEVVADGLNNPYKLTFGPGGDLYVAEAGTGGDGPCTMLGDGPDPSCYGPTGAIVRIVDGDGAVTRVIEGLPSAAQEGNVAVGPHDVAFAPDGTTYVAVGLGGDQADRVALGAAGPTFGTVLQVAPGATTATVLSDLTAFEVSDNPDQDEDESEIDSNPFGLERAADGNLLAVDAGGNSLLHAAPGAVALIGDAFEFGTAPAPPFLGLPPGATIPVQPVPTAVEQAPDGTVYVSQLTGFPFPVGAANVFSIAADGSHSVAESGFTNIIDIAFGADGTMYVLQFASNGILNEDNPAPQLIQVREDGTRKVLLSSELVAPGGVTVGPDGMVYVTNGAVLGGAGSVLRVDPSVARDAAIADACPPADVPGSGFADAAGNIHQEAIECLAWWEVVNGVSPTAFQVARVTTRGEVAAILARLVTQGGVTLEASPAAPFSDTSGHVHALAINQLAAAGVILGYPDDTFRPDRSISRADVAALLVRAHELVTDGDLPDGPDAFDDDDGNVHEAAIDAAAAAGWVRGTGTRTFDPAGLTTRAQLASMAARMLSTLVDGGFADLPT